MFLDIDSVGAHECDVCCFFNLLLLGHHTGGKDSVVEFCEIQCIWRVVFVVRELEGWCGFKTTFVCQVFLSVGEEAWWI